MYMGIWIKKKCVYMWVSRVTLDHLLDARVVALKDILMRQLDEQAIDGPHAQDEQRFEYNRQSAKVEKVTV